MWPYENCKKKNSKHGIGAGAARSHLSQNADSEETRDA
jgi:hypothetical protein